MTYRGRFAPSPTGPLHFGSLIAALGSYLEANAQGGAWLVRMEDIDVPRNVPGAADDILRVLEAFGFAWSGPVLYQQQRLEAYVAALESLKRLGLAYGCACSRKEIAEAAGAPAVDGGLRYSGKCRAGLPPGSSPRAWRFAVGDRVMTFEDRVQGRQTQSLADAVGDFVLLRADGLFSYQLAVTVDDAFQGISEVVRGADLLLSTPRQMALQDALGLPSLRYAHLPVACHASGEKLSKQTLAPAIHPDQAADLLLQAFVFLGQCAPPVSALPLSLSEVWDWMRLKWSLARVPRCPAIPLDTPWAHPVRAMPGPGGH